MLKGCHINMSALLCYYIHINPSDYLQKSEKLKSRLSGSLYGKATLATDCDY